MAKITIYVPEQPPAKYGLEEMDEISIGRAPDCDIVIDHSSVSGHHAFIRRIGAGLHVLVDNGSTNGIYLEGSQVPEAPLSNGASFMIGSVPCEYEGDHERSVPAAASRNADTAGNPVSGSTTQIMNASSVGSAASSSGHGYGSPIAQISENSTRPGGYNDMSPVEKIVKKDSLSQIALIMGLAAILSAVALILTTFFMKA